MTSAVRRRFGVLRALCALALVATSAGVSALAPAAHAFVPTEIVGPAGSNLFGRNALVLSNGNIVVTDPQFDLPGGNSSVGAVYLYDGITQAFISRLVGVQANDNVGARFFEVGDSNFIVLSPGWNNGAVVDAGAITWVNGATGLEGAVSATNSIIGSAANDRVGSGVFIALTNGNAAVASPEWNNGFGAVTWMNGSDRSSFTLSSANSLVGSHVNDNVGYYLEALTNGNYVTSSVLWDSTSGTSNVGAATWGNGTTGTVGPVSSTNSLVGSQASDRVGSQLVPLANGHYVVTSTRWSNGATTSVGAVTWGNGATGIAGPVTTANSLVGVTANDQVGGETVALTNGNYVVASSAFDAVSIVDAGAATWGNGVTGTVGVVSTANSLYGTSTSDSIGSGGVTPLANGNYAVNSPNWRNGTAPSAGAVTWASGTTGRSGAVSASNSMVGSHANDEIGVYVVALTNGNYVVGAPDWDNGVTADTGAATWGNGTTGTVGTVGSAISLVGATTGDGVGGTIVALANGNYVVASPFWNRSLLVDAGATTWGNGASGVVGAVGTGNSYVGSKASDEVGWSVEPLTGGDYVISSPKWDNGAVFDAGAATRVTGAFASTGSVSTTNSLVGVTYNDQVADAGIYALPNGDYVVLSSLIDDGAAIDAGFAQWVGPGGFIGTIDHTISSLGAFGTPPGILIKADGRLTAGFQALVTTTQKRVLLLSTDPPATFAPFAPQRYADTRPSGTTFDTLFAAGGLRAAGSTLALKVIGRGFVYNRSVAVSMNVTVVDAAGDGYATVYPCGSPQPTSSSLNFAEGSTVPNAVISKVGTAGEVCIYLSAAAHLLVDVNGAFPSSTSLRPINPARMIDTRSGSPTFDNVASGAGLRPGGSITQIPIAGRAGVPASATTAVLNVTVTGTADAGFITVFPCGSTQPDASSINYGTDATIANTVVSKLGTGGKVCVFTQAGAHLIADLVGYFPAQTEYEPLNPARLLDTRPAGVTIDSVSQRAGLRPAGSITEVLVGGRGGVRTNRYAVVLNVTVVEPTAAGYVTVYPCTAAPPNASNLNFVAGQTVANAVVVDMSAGYKVCIFNSAPTQVLVDVTGFVPGDLIT
jgi:trimeric autotransporter adhesin